MIKNKKQIQKDYYDGYIKSQKNKKRICLYPNCSNKAISSHNISETLLRTFEENGHVRVLNINPWIKETLEFKSMGVDEATSFYGFCTHHDSKLFKQIDTSFIDLEKPHNLLLLQYRALMQEKIRKTIWLDTYTYFSKKIIDYNDSLLLLHPLFAHALQRIEQYNFNFLSIDWFQNELFKSLSGENQFRFEIIEFPYYEIAASELFTFEIDSITELKRNFFTRYQLLLPFSELFIQIIPSKKSNKTFIITGAHKKDFEVFKFFLEQFRRKSSEKALSDLLLLYTENWACSESFYKKYLRGNTLFIKELFQATAGRPTIERFTRKNILRAI